MASALTTALIAAAAASDRTWTDKDDGNAFYSYESPGFYGQVWLDVPSGQYHWEMWTGGRNRPIAVESSGSGTDADAVLAEAGNALDSAASR